MSPTHDYIIDNSTGANVRSDINSVLQAIATNNSSASTPPTPYASQFYADTSTNTLRIRNTSNNAYINLFSLTGAPAFPLDGTINSVNIGKGANSVAGNTVLGENALDAAVTGGSNTAIGNNTLTVLTSGNENTAVGDAALKDNTTGTHNVAIGDDALTNNETASNNTAVGHHVLETNTTGAGNTAIGSAALDTNSTGSNNTAVGMLALDANTTGSKCTAVGFNALATCQSVDGLTAVGSQALESNTTGSNNTALGNSALKTLSTGGSNCAVGVNSSLTMDTGSDNCSMGVNSLRLCEGGSQNTTIGRDAGESISTGSFNTCLGFEAGKALTTGSNNLFLGHDAGTSSAPNGNHVGASNSIVLGDNSITQAHIKVAFTATSDERDKADITDFTKGLDIVNNLRPVTYKWDMRSDYSKDLDVTPDGSKKSNITEIGLIAQEVELVEKANGYSSSENDRLFIHKSTDGLHYGLKYSRLVPVLINAIKELSAKVTALEAG